MAWLELLAATFCVSGLLTLVGAVRGRGAGAANAMGVLAVLTGVGMAGIGINHFVVAGLSQSGLSEPDAVRGKRRWPALVSGRRRGGDQPARR